MRTLLIDNYDSYTFNLYQLIAEVNGEEPLVVRNDQLVWADLASYDLDNIVISPGPGRPDNERDFGVCREVLLKSNLPVLGVCLGHQGLGYVYGTNVIHAPEVMHGRLSPVFHSQAELFEGIPQGFHAVRYHSLVVEDQLPECLEQIAWTEDGIIMGLRHRTRPFWGVQFHPESICTEHGRKLFENFREITRRSGPRCHLPGNQKERLQPSTSISLVPRGKSQRSPHEGGSFKVCIRKLDTLFDPERVFVHMLGREPSAFWLDSSRAETGLSRFSFMGASTGPLSQVVRYDTDLGELVVTSNGATLRHSESIFDYLKREIARMGCASSDAPFDFNCGFVGYFGYELKAECGADRSFRSPLPDATFIFADRLIVFDHLENVTYLACLVHHEDADAADGWFDATDHQLRALPPLPPLDNCRCDAGQDPIEFHFSRPYEEYLENIEECKRYLTDGETYEICLTNRISTDAVVDPLTLYRRLRQINPAPYSAFLRFGDVAIVSSSPERFLKIDRRGWVEAKPIKGTVARGRTADEDSSLREALRCSEKDRAENLMIVDLLRNDLGLVCEVGSVHVPKLMDVEAYETVHQLVSTIRGKLREDMAATDCVRSAFPGGSMTGAPKLRTMQIIDSLEGEARSVYSGALGFLGLNGTADLNIVIRTIVTTPTSATIGVGGAVVILSDPDSEFDETLLKAQALIRAIVMTARGHFSPEEYRIVGNRMPMEVGAGSD